MNTGKATAKLAATCIVALASGPAHAHGAMAGMPDFVAGMVHPLTAIEHVLPIVAFGILVGQNGLQRCEAVLFAFPPALAAGAFLSLRLAGLSYTALLGILSTIAIGGLIAFAFSLPRTLLVAFGIFLGLLIGYANGAAIEGSIRALPFIVGMVVAASLAMYYGVAAADYLLARKLQWLPIAIRVIGSWTAAIGLLVLSVTHKILFAS